MKKFLFLVFFLFSIFYTFFTENIITSVSAQIVSSAFRDLNIELNKNIATEYFVGDGMLIEGKVLDKNKYVLFFLKNIETEEKIMEVINVDVNGNFHISISLPKKSGKYVVIVTSGLSFDTKIYETLSLVEKKASENIGISASQIHPTMVYENHPYLFFGSNMWGELTLEQGKKNQKKSGEIILFDDLNLQYDNSQSILRGYSRDTRTGFSWSGSVFIDRTRDLIGKNLVSLTTLRSIGKMQFRVKKGQKVKENYFLTTPGGDVLEYHFPKNYIGTDGYLRTDILIKQSFSIPDSGVYKIETVQNDGLAYFNLPISKVPFWSIKNPLTEEQKIILRTDKKRIDIDTITSINKIRVSLGRSVLIQDKTLTEFAQKKAEDMAKYNYLGHTTKSGLDNLSFAKSLGIEIKGKLGENVAGGGVSDIYLQDGLEESGSHRHNMVDGQFKKIGIGYVLRGNRTYMVQYFGE